MGGILDKPLTLEKGASFVFKFTESHRAEGGVETPFDLTGTTTTFQINNLNADPVVIVHTATTDNGQITIDDNTTTINIPAATTAAFAVEGEYNFSVQRTTTASGVVDTRLRGIIDIIAASIADEG